MKFLVVVAAVLAVTLAGPAPAASGPSLGDQESQASESVSKRGAARLSPVSGNSIADNSVSAAPQQQQQQQQQVSQLQLQSPAPQQLPLYAPHPYSFVAPQPQPIFQYQPTPLLHSKYHVPAKPMQLQYVHPYFQVPQYQAPLMYFIPQPHPQVSHAPQAHHQQNAGSQAGGQPEQTAPQQPQQAHHQPHQYVMVLSAPPAPLAPTAQGFQYFNHPQLALQPQPLITFYAGQQPQLHQHQLHQPQLQLPQVPQHQQSRFYPEQQQLIYQSQQPEGPGPQNDGPPQFVQKQQSTLGLEAPAPPNGPNGPTPATLVGSYGARVQPQHTYKTIIKA